MKRTTRLAERGEIASERQVGLRVEALQAPDRAHPIQIRSYPPVVRSKSRRDSGFDNQLKKRSVAVRFTQTLPISSLKCRKKGACA